MLKRISYMPPARHFEELQSDKTAASCHGCACLYTGLKTFKDGVMHGTLKPIADAHEEFKKAAAFYKRAESDVGTDVISTINEVVSAIEKYVDALRAGKKLMIREYLPIYETINTLKFHLVSFC